MEQINRLIEELLDLIAKHDEDVKQRIQVIKTRLSEISNNNTK